jgi:hypothetical protein
MLTVVPAPPVTMNLLGPAGVGSVIGAVPWENIPKVVDAIAGFLGYFGSNYKVTGREMTVAKQALLASTAGSLVASGGPAVFIPNFHAAGASPLLRDLTLRAALLKTERDLLAEELPAADSRPLTSILNGDRGDGGEGDQAGEGESPDLEPLKLVAKAVQRTTAVLRTYEGFRTDWTGQPATKPEGQEGATAAAATRARPEA